MDISKDEIIPLILAGGRGTRIAHLYPDLPKPVMPVAGKPFLVWILEQLHHAGFERAVVSSGHLSEKLKLETAPWIPQGMRVDWVEESSPLGTAGGAAYAAKASGQNPKAWLIMNGDSYLTGDWFDRIQECSLPDLSIVACQMEDTGRYGRLVTDGERLVSFSEKKESGRGLINAGIYLIPGRLLATVDVDKPSSLESDVIPDFLMRGENINVIRSTSSFIDIGTPESFAESKRFFQQLELKN
jgi:D-glycero-alpha-D-manno-heptose 1-phosphate guanylyltransferase